MKNFSTKLICLLLFLTFCLAYQPVFAASKVNLNTATVEQLVELKGIGEKTAEKIVAYRKITKFKSIDELMNVKGIGEKGLAKIRNQITVDVKKKKKKK